MSSKKPWQNDTGVLRLLGSETKISENLYWKNVFVHKKVSLFRSVRQSLLDFSAIDVLQLEFRTPDGNKIM